MATLKVLIRSTIFVALMIVIFILQNKLFLLGIRGIFSLPWIAFVIIIGVFEGLILGLFSLVIALPIAILTGILRPGSGVAFVIILLLSIVNFIHQAIATWSSADFAFWTVIGKIALTMVFFQFNMMMISIGTSAFQGTRELQEQSRYRGDF